MLAQYWLNLGMITPSSTDLQHYYSTGAVLGTSTGPVMVVSTAQVLNDSPGGVLALAHYWSPVLGQYLFRVLRQYCSNAEY